MEKGSRGYMMAGMLRPSMVALCEFYCPSRIHNAQHNAAIGSSYSRQIAVGLANLTAAGGST